MKKLMMILAVVIVATACEGPMGPMGPMGPPGQDGGGNVNKYMKDNIIVSSDDWEENWEVIDGKNTLTSYRAEVYIPQFTKQMFDTGFYYTYWKYTEDNGETMFYIQEGEGVTIYLKDGDTYFEETITCDYMAEYLTIYYRSSDFQSGHPQTDYVFRFVAFY